MFPTAQYRQELARQQYADLLREVHAQRIAAVEREERDRGLRGRARRLVVRCGDMLRRGDRARAIAPAPRAAAQ